MRDGAGWTGFFLFAFGFNSDPTISTPCFTTSCLGNEIHELDRSVNLLNYLVSVQQLLLSEGGWSTLLSLRAHTTKSKEGIFSTEQSPRFLVLSGTTMLCIHLSVSHSEFIAISLCLSGYHDYLPCTYASAAARRSSPTPSFQYQAAILIIYCLDHVFCIISPSLKKEPMKPEPTKRLQLAQNANAHTNFLAILFSVVFSLLELVPVPMK